jgi:hypothetical protein
MKCVACGFEEKSKIVEYDEAILYKRGKRKGEVREINHVEYDLFEQEPKFQRVFIGDVQYSFGRVVKEQYLYVEDVDGQFDEVKLFACPECGTIKMGGYFD